MLSRIDSERVRQGLAPRRFAVPLDDRRLPVGDCPACWNLIDLTSARRIAAHGGGCPGSGMRPRTTSTPLDREAGPPQGERWWRHPTCQRCAAYLVDGRGNPRWDVTAEVLFICAGGCRIATVAQLIHERSIR